MKAANLFEGIGGFGLALERNGVTVTTAVEIDKNCRNVLTRHFPQVKLLNDVREVTANDLGSCEILTAGWPCQGNSVAGRRGGLADPRSGLWSEVARLLGEVRPQWFVGENVPGLLTVRRGADFYQVIKSLDELGYGYAWRVLDAQYFGVPQRRKRVFIVGCLGDGAGAAEVLFDTEGIGRDSAPSCEAEARDPRAATVGTLEGGSGAHGYRLDAETAADNKLVVVSTLQGGGRRGYRIDAEAAAGGHLVPQIVGTLDAHDGPHGHGGANVQSAFAGHYIPAYDPAYAVPSHHYHDDRENNYVVLAQNGSDIQVGDQLGALTAGVARQTSGDLIYRFPNAVRRLTPLECERLQGFPDGWTDGQSDSARYRQLGNAVAVPVVEWVIRRIVSHQARQYSENRSTSNQEKVA